MTTLRKETLERLLDLASLDSRIEEEDIIYREPETIKGSSNPGSDQPRLRGQITGLRTLRS